MKRLIPPALTVSVMIVAFIFGASSQSIIPMMISFCGLPFAFMWVGYAFASAGIRISISTNETYAPAPVQRQRANGRQQKRREVARDFD